MAPTSSLEVYGESISASLPVNAKLASRRRGEGHGGGVPGLHQSRMNGNLLSEKRERVSRQSPSCPDCVLLLMRRLTER